MIDVMIAEAIRYAAQMIGWILVASLLVIGSVIKWAVGRIERSFDSINEKLVALDKSQYAIRDLLTSEIAKLRDMQHKIDLRLTLVEIETRKQDAGHQAHGP